VIDPCHPSTSALWPGYTMKKSTRAEKRRKAQAVYSRRKCPLGRGKHDQKRAGHQRDEKSVEMKDTTQKWSRGLFDRRCMLIHTFELPRSTSERERSVPDTATTVHGQPAIRTRPQNNESVAFSSETERFCADVAVTAGEDRPTGR
jgi:hypothetical protein